MFGGSQTNFLGSTPGTIQGSQNFPSSSPTDSRVPMTPNINRHSISIDQYVPSTPASQVRHCYVITHLTPAITTMTPEPVVSLGTSPINALTPLHSSALVPCVFQTHISDQLVPTTPEGLIQVSQNNGCMEQPMVPTKDGLQSKINPGPFERNKIQIKASTKKHFSSRRRLSLDKTCERPPQNSPPTGTSSNNSLTDENNEPVSDKEFLPSLLTRKSAIKDFPPSSNHFSSLGACQQSYTQRSPINDDSLSPQPGSSYHGQTGPPSSKDDELHETRPVVHLSSTCNKLHTTRAALYSSSAGFAAHETLPLGYPSSSITSLHDRDEVTRVSSSHSRDEVTRARLEAHLGSCSVRTPSSNHVVPSQSTPKIDLFSGEDIFFC